MVTWLGRYSSCPLPGVWGRTSRLSALSRSSAPSCFLLIAGPPLSTLTVPWNERGPHEHFASALRLSHAPRLHRHFPEAFGMRVCPVRGSVAAPCYLVKPLSHPPLGVLHPSSKLPTLSTETLSAKCFLFKPKLKVDRNCGFQLEKVIFSLRFKVKK